MLPVQKYLIDNGLQKLKDEFGIETHEYDDLVVLNYGLKSQKFNPITDSCRALILEKNTWNVLARSFDRFYNLNEGNTDFNFNENTKYYEKLDGSLISVYCHKDKWNMSTRSMAFAEGQIHMGNGSFYDLFMKAAKKTNLIEFLNSSDKNITYVFELTSPENRVVTRYPDVSISLIAARNNKTMNEYHSCILDEFAMLHIKCKRPKCFNFKNADEMINYKLDTLEEGFVAINEIHNIYGSFERVKCKNPKWVSIAHLKDNNNVSSKKLLVLVLSGEQKEFLSYFPEYDKYVQFIEIELNNYMLSVKDNWEKYKHIENQKKFAITITSNIKQKSIIGLLFNMKKGKTFEQTTTFDYKIKTEVNKLYEMLDLKNKFINKFNIKDEEEDE